MLEYKKYDLLISPIITEKYSLQNQYGVYIFRVLKGSTKASLKEAVEFIFGVKVKNIRVLNTKGKVKIFKGKKGSQSGFKKAFITLKENYTIDYSKYGSA